MLSKAKAMQEKMAEVQKKVEEAEVKGSSGGNAVEVTMNGKHMCMSVVNKSSSEKILLKVPYLDRIAENYCIEGSNKVDLNTYANTSKVKIKKNSLKTSKGFLILPPHSISVVLFNI